MDSGHEEDKGGLPDLTKKILTLGLGAYFLTEDTVRRYVKDAKLPRDVARSITQNAAKGKDELYGFVARELSDFLEKMDLQEELQRFVASHKIKINAEIEFVSRKTEAPARDSEPGEEDPGQDSSEGLEWNLSIKGAPPRTDAVGEPEAS